MKDSEYGYNCMNDESEGEELVHISDINGGSWQQMSFLTSSQHALPHLLGDSSYKSYDDVFKLFYAEEW